jgi:hypothetical protein
LALKDSIDWQRLAKMVAVRRRTPTSSSIPETSKFHP